MSGSFFWHFVLVNRPFEHIFVFRKRNGQWHNIHGTHPRGFSCDLAIGDRVLVKRPGNKWQLKFRVVLHPSRHYPAIKYGERYGPFPGQYRKLADLPEAAFANAGIDPAWISEKFTNPTNGGTK